MTGYAVLHVISKASLLSGHPRNDPHLRPLRIPQPVYGRAIDGPHIQHASLRVRGGAAPVAAAKLARHLDGVARSGRREDAFIARLEQNLPQALSLRRVDIWI